MCPVLLPYKKMGQLLVRTSSIHVEARLAFPLALPLWTRFVY